MPIVPPTPVRPVPSVADIGTDAYRKVFLPGHPPEYIRNAMLAAGIILPEGGGGGGGITQAQVQQWIIADTLALARDVAAFNVAADARVVAGTLEAARNESTLDGVIDGRVRNPALVGNTDRWEKAQQHADTVYTGNQGLLPAVTAADNGEVLTVVDGAWAKAAASAGGGLDVAAVDARITPMGRESLTTLSASEKAAARARIGALAPEGEWSDWANHEYARPGIGGVLQDTGFDIPDGATEVEVGVNRGPDGFTTILHVATFLALPDRVAGSNAITDTTGVTHRVLTDEQDDPGDRIQSYWAHAGRRVLGTSGLITGVGDPINDTISYRWRAAGVELAALAGYEDRWGKTKLPSDVVYQAALDAVMARLLPAASASDHGKVPKVDENGNWVMATDETGGGGTTPARLRSVQLAATVAPTLVPNAWSNWVDCASIDVAENEAGSVLVFGQVYAITAGAGDGGSRTWTEVRIMRTRSSADTKLIDNRVIYGPRSLGGGAIAPSTQAVSNQVSDEKFVVDNAQAGDTYKVQARVYAQAPIGATSTAVTASMPAGAANQISLWRPAASAGAPAVTSYPASPGVGDHVIAIGEIETSDYTVVAWPTAGRVELGTKDGHGYYVGYGLSGYAGRWTVERGGGSVNVTQLEIVEAGGAVTTIPVAQAGATHFFQSGASPAIVPSASTRYGFNALLSDGSKVKASFDTEDGDDMRWDGFRWVETSQIHSKHDVLELVAAQAHATDPEGEWPFERLPLKYASSAAARPASHVNDNRFYFFPAA